MNTLIIYIHRNIIMPISTLPSTNDSYYGGVSVSAAASASAAIVVQSPSPSGSRVSGGVGSGTPSMDYQTWLSNVAPKPWNASQVYKPGDRVVRGQDIYQVPAHAAPHQGVKPGADDSKWLYAGKVKNEYALETHYSSGTQYSGVGSNKTIHAPNADKYHRGPKGPPGDRGPQGVPGQRGPAGTNGKDGKDGKDGVNGKDGKDGKDGLRGKVGKEGKDGLKGKDGANGRDGASGKDGLKGKDGRDGKDGLNGKDGANGKDGLNGKNGKDGKDGANGRDGANGKDGLKGKDGRDGKDGLNGKDGANGKDGLNGKNGKDGVNGKDGKDGLNGKDGKDGLNGKNGKDGVDGKNGLKGKDGKDGVNGKDGQPGGLSLKGKVEAAFWGFIGGHVGGFNAASLKEFAGFVKNKLTGQGYDNKEVDDAIKHEENHDFSGFIHGYGVSRPTWSLGRDVINHGAVGDVYDGNKGQWRHTAPPINSPPIIYGGYSNYTSNVTPGGSTPFKPAVSPPQSGNA
ncbi:hypothetical protein [Dyella monticola]|uniref:hypothetical protein n=1 Tax=Dyella monticola TaxID=1927958 RepID=UPI001E4E47DE|nr:hypothetical protein [Dyella monticola]